MALFSRRDGGQKKADPTAIWFCAGSAFPTGYYRLLDAPEVAACIDRITAVIAGATIATFENTPKGDMRVRDTLSRFIDQTPWKPMSTRSQWMSWIVATLIGEGDGNAFCLPHTAGNNLTGLEPMPDAMAVTDGGNSYRIVWRGESYAPDEVLHFRLFADLLEPWRGRGYRASAGQIAGSLIQANELKTNLTSPSYKPPLVVAVNSDTDLSDEDSREEFRRRYLEDADAGKPWILPADFVSISQIKPLTLSDLAIRDTMELDKRTVAGIFGVPPFLLGLGSFNEQEYNGFIRTTVLPICKGIEQELTNKLLINKRRYFKFNRRHLFSYDLQTLINMDLAMSDRGYLNGDEVREDAFREPAGLDDYKVLENYIPYDMSGQQSKLVSDSDTGGGSTEPAAHDKEEEKE